MRRLSLLGILLLCACAGEQDPGLQPEEPSASSPLVLASDTPSAAPASAVAGDHHIAAVFPDGREHEYLLHAPPDVEDGRQLPLVLVFHGLPGSPEEMVRITRFSDLADDQGFMVVYPSYFAAADVKPLLDHLTEIWPIDPRRVYASGFSRGAATTYDLTGLLADRIAAFAPISGIASDLSPHTTTSLIAVQGGQDDFAPDFPTVNRDWARVAGCGSVTTTEVTFAARPTTRFVARCRAGTEHVVYHVERMGHAWPRQATRLVWRFFVDHPLAD